MDDFNRIVRHGVVSAGGRSKLSEQYLDSLVAKAHALGPRQLAELLIEFRAEPVASLIERLNALVSLRDRKVPHGER